ncbi:MAG: Carboxyl-terminal-processing protease [Cyanobacteriota bacterium]|jgi:carboxyl-terminal processing protease
MPPLAQPSATTVRRRLLAWLLVLTTLVLTPATALGLSDAQQLVVEAWRLVNQSYVDPGRFDSVRWTRLRQKALERPIVTSSDAYDAIEWMLAPIGDPYTRLLRPQDFSTLQSNTQGTVSGVGLQLGQRDGDGRILVIAPLENSPASAAGIPAGAELLSVDGQSAQELGLEATAARLRGPAASRVLITWRLDAGPPKETDLERRAIDLRPVRSSEIEHHGHRLGVLRITQFSEPVPSQVQQALKDLNNADVEGLVLDLRNNSGGLVSAGLAVANALLDREPIVETVNRDALASLEQAGAGALYTGPLVTLVNGGTASASEILAGALQDDGRSRLLGSRTFGKGLIQTLIPLGNGSGLAVTVARYRTPSGRDIQHLGIEPDQLLPQPEPLAPGGDDDSWLQAALDSLVPEEGEG